MVKISQNNSQLILLVDDEEKAKLGGLLDALTEEGHGRISGNTVEVDKKDHTFTVPDMVVAIKNFCNKQKLELNCDYESEEIIKQNDSLKEQKNQIDAASEQYLTRKNEENFDVKLPDTFKRKLKEYQKPSVDHLFTLGNGANFSVPGSGKTSIALAAYSLMKQNDQVEHILVICPRSAYMSWEDEFEQCFGRPSNTVRLNRENIENQHPNADIFLSTYQLMSYRPDDFIRLLQNHKILMILDESHYIKNGKKMNPTSWSKVARDVAPFAKRRMILSGTPCPQALDDLWTQIDFLYPNQRILGSFDLFRSYTKTHENLGIYDNDVRRLFTRITKNDLGLPDPKFIEYNIPMDELQTKIYNSIEARAIEELIAESKLEHSKMVKYRGDRGGKIIRVLQAASNPVLLTKNDKEFDFTNTDTLIDVDTSELIEKYAQQGQIPTKLMEACKLAKELAESGKKVIFWTSFLHNIDMIEEQLLRDNVNKNQVLKITGAIPKDDEEDKNYNREKIIRAFKENPNYKILIATPPSCSESISLHINSRGETVCTDAIYFDRTFNAAHYIQSKDRIHRIGMKDDTKVTYHIFRSTYPPVDGKDPILCNIDDWTHNRLKRKETRMLEALGDEITTFDLNTEQKSYPLDEVLEDRESFLADLRKKGVIK